MTEKEKQMQQVYCRDLQAWHQWLKKHHAQKEPIWLVLHKKNADEPSVTYSEAVDEALCWGWIDSKAIKLDEQRYLQIFSPRKPRSVWSKVNKNKIEKLLAEGRMQSAGQAKIDAAKADGSWAALDEVEEFVIPDDLAKALAASKTAQENFDAFAKSIRKYCLQWLASAKREETRANRIAAIVTAAEEKRNLMAYVPADKRKAQD